MSDNLNHRLSVTFPSLQIEYYNLDRVDPTVRLQCRFSVACLGPTIALNNLVISMR
jgi:hypothetical protein